jgi:hypothetical protein
MGKRELKKQYPDLDYNFIDLVSMLDTTKNNKLTPFLVKQFHDWIQFRGDEKQDSAKEYYKMCEVLGTPTNELDEILKRMTFKWAQPKLEIIEEFTEHMNANRLVDNDINNYETWESLRTAVSEAEQKHGIKTKKNRIMILHQDSEWFVMKPLSIEASANYGMGTKWCTSSMNGDFFHRYSKDGVLIYVINRKNSTKYAFYSSPKEFSVWTEGDARIDSMETIIPFDLLKQVREWCDFKVVGPNYDYFEDEDKQGVKSKILFGEFRGENVFTTAEVRMDDEPRADIATLINSVAESVGGEVEFGGDEEVIEEEIMDAVEEPMVMENERISIDIRPQEEQLVGLGDSVHGRETPRGERTWSNPYPNGPGGGFNLPDLTEDEGEYVTGEDVPEDAIPANEETRAAFVGVVTGGEDMAMEVGYDEGVDTAG